MTLDLGYGKDGVSDVDRKATIYDLKAIWVGYRSLVEWLIYTEAFHVTGGSFQNRSLRTMI